MTTYVIGDVRNIQGYIFASPRLLEMRAGSALLDFFNRRVVHALGSHHGGDVVFSGGGNFIVKLPDDGATDRFEADIRAAFLELTGGGALSIARTPAAPSFLDTQKALRAALGRVKRHSGTPRQLGSMPFLRRCDSCGQEAADHPFTRPDADTMPERDRHQWLGPVCARKQRFHRLLRQARKSRSTPRHEMFVASSHSFSEELVPVVTDYLAGAELPKDFRDMVGDDDLAIVVADGNNLGSWFEALEEDRYRQLSERVDQELRDSLDTATRDVFGEEPPLLQVLICGGDDLVAALPGRHALPFVHRLLREFEVAHPEDDQRTTGMAAALVFCRPGFPFRQAHHLAHQLLEQTKIRCRHDGLPWGLGLHRVNASQVQSLAHEHAAIERHDGLGHLWSYGSAGPYGPDELDALLETSRRLSTLPRSQLGRLRELLSPGDDDATSPLDTTWGVPARLVAELRAWLGRLEPEHRPFEATTTPPPGIVRVVPASDHEPRTQHRLILADALTLAMQGD